MPILESLADRIGGTQLDAGGATVAAVNVVSRVVRSDWKRVVGILHGLTVIGFAAADFRRVMAGVSSLTLIPEVWDCALIVSAQLSCGI